MGRSGRRGRLARRCGSVRKGHVMVDLDRLHPPGVGRVPAAGGALLRPPALGEGSRVGVAALSGPVDPDRLRAGLDRLESWGFEPVLAGNLPLRTGFLAGRDEERVEGLHALLRQDVDAVIFARGGHGVLRLLDRLDWRLIGERPRWFVGYSDLTPFLLEVTRRFQWQTLHGPMVATDLHRDLSGVEEQALLGCLRGGGWPETRLTRVGGPLESAGAQGRVVAGCLSMVCAVLGTAYSPTDLFDDAVVLLEDVGESAYKIDRMLSQLRLAGLGRARALVFGHCHARHEDVESACARGSEAEATDEVVEVLAEQAERLQIPVWFGLGFGHGTPNLAIPVGAAGRIAEERLFIDLDSPPAGHPATSGSRVE